MQSNDNSLVDFLTKDTTSNSIFKVDSKSFVLHNFDHIKALNLRKPRKTVKLVI